MVQGSRSGRPLGLRAFVPAAARVARTPAVWGVAVRQLAAMSPPRWWRRAPFAPRPDRDYVRFRTETAYGPDARPGAEDLVAYLRWCKAAGR